MLDTSFYCYSCLFLFCLLSAGAALPTAHAEIGDLPVPLLDVPSAALLHSANGVEVSTGISSNTYSTMVSSAGTDFRMSLVVFRKSCVPLDIISSHSISHKFAPNHFVFSSVFIQSPLR